MQFLILLGSFSYHARSVPIRGLICACRALELVPPPKQPYSQEDHLWGKGPVLAVVPVDDSAYQSTSDLPAASEAERFGGSQQSSCDDREPQAGSLPEAEPQTMHR